MEISQRSILMMPLIALASAVGANGQSVTTDTIAIIRQIENPGNITVTIPAGLDKRLTAEQTGENATTTEQDESKAASTSRNTTRVGYRVQVLDDNNPRTAKHEAQNRRRLIESRFSEYRTYVVFNSPYWRVKVGDFRTRSEADAAMASIRAAFPKFSNQLRVVRDKINVSR